MKKLLFFIVLFCSNVFAHTDEYLYIGSAYYHFDREEDLNDVGGMLGYNKHGIYALAYKNSYGDNSLTIGRQIKTFKLHKDFDLTFYGGVTLGYWQCYGPKEPGDQMRNICPDLAAEFVYTKYRWQPVIVVKPKVAAFMVRRLM